MAWAFGPDLMRRSACWQPEADRNASVRESISFVISHIEQHSKKPDEVRDKIVKLMGDQPRVELFARQKTPGWDVWGNEVNCTLTMPERKG